MQHEGGFHLDDVRHIQSDEALLSVLGFSQLSTSMTLGDWLRRMGRKPEAQTAWAKVN